MINLTPLNGGIPAAILRLSLLLLITLAAQTQFAAAQSLGRRLDARNTKVEMVSESPDAVAAAALSITPLTWGVAGLDSNNVTVGPNLFPVGARVCNTGNAAATNLVSTFVWDTANALIGLRTGSNSSLNVASLAAGACTDLYYEVQITRSAAAYDTNRRYHVTATADTLPVVSTPTPREIYVEKLISQNRNSVDGIKLNGVAVPFGGSMNMVVGNTYTIQLLAATAPGGYEQLESFINLPNVIFQTLSVTSSYSAPTGYGSTKLYEDACGWDSNPMSATYRSCIGPLGVTGGKAGGTVTLTYTVKVLSGGGTSQTLNTLIHDFSGSSFHYNSDFAAQSVVAKILNPPSAANVSVSGRVISAEGRGIANVRVSLIEADGTVHTAVTGRRGAYAFEDLEDGQTVVISLAARRFTFSESVRVLSLVDNVSDLDFQADR
jgi:hypothetical protein